MPTAAQPAAARPGRPLRVLVLNAGSATLKFAVCDAQASDPVGGVTCRVRGMLPTAGGSTGEQARIRVEGAAPGGDPGPGHAPVARVLGWLHLHDLLATVDAVGHRVVHGGPHLTGATAVDDDVLATIEAASDLAPLHNGPALACLRQASRLLDEHPHVAVFDTGFHADLPARARTYPIPPGLAARHGLRRYGFHGLAHRWMWERWLALSGADPGTSRAITLQLGSGCSAAAVHGGRCLDTSMGVTPLEGLMMRTRSGSVDPALVPLLARREGLPPDEVERMLNRESGLAGIGGHGGHVERLLQAEAAGDRQAALALDMFCYRVAKQVGAYLATLRGADVIVFGGGVGENAPAVRARALEGFGWCGVDLDLEANAATAGHEQRISTVGSQVQVWVLPVDEAAVIAAEVRRVVPAGSRSQPC